MGAVAFFNLFIISAAFNPGPPTPQDSLSRVLGPYSVPLCPDWQCHLRPVVPQASQYRGFKPRLLSPSNCSARGTHGPANRTIPVAQTPGYFSHFPLRPTHPHAWKPYLTSISPRAHPISRHCHLHHHSSTVLLPPSILPASHPHLHLLTTPPCLITLPNHHRPITLHIILLPTPLLPPSLPSQWPPTPLQAAVAFHLIVWTSSPARLPSSTPTPFIQLHL